MEGYTDHTFNIKFIFSFSSVSSIHSAEYSGLGSDNSQVKAQIRVELGLGLG